MKQQAELDLAKIEAETLARGEVDRENHDLIMERIKLESKLKRERALESIK